MDSGTAGYRQATWKRMILATASSGLPAALSETQFHAMPESEIFHVLQTSGLWVGPREMLEELPLFRQIIPYVILVCEGKVVRYTRTPAGGEARLHGRVSFGVGGHIDLSDIVAANNSVDIAATLLGAAKRELEEEVGVFEDLSHNWIGLLVENQTAVGRVHVGVVGVWHLQAPPAAIPEDCLSELSLCGVKELEAERGRLESWSAMLVPFLNNAVRLTRAREPQTTL